MKGYMVKGCVIKFNNMLCIKSIFTRLHNDN